MMMRTTPATRPKKKLATNPEPVVLKNYKGVRQLRPNILHNALHGSGPLRATTLSLHNRVKAVKVKVVDLLPSESKVQMTPSYSNLGTAHGANRPAFAGVILPK
jgi:hypothetical protein